MPSSDPLDRRPAIVAAVTMPTPRVVRVVARGDLLDWPEPGPAAGVKVFLPDTPSGPVTRTYTVRDWSRERGEVTIDMALNDGHGPATQWASRVVPGMRLEISDRSSSTFTPERHGGSYLFVGDETAVPAITTCVASLPADAAATTVLAVQDAGERQAMESPARLDLRWVSGDTETDFTSTVLSAARELQPTLVWVACEERAMRTIRRALLEHGLSPEQLSTHGYWERKESAHLDHLSGEEIS